MQNECSILAVYSSSMREQPTSDHIMFAPHNAILAHAKMDGWTTDTKQCIRANRA